MMFIVRAAVLGLAAFGAKNLYERYREHEPQLREQGRTLTEDVQRLAKDARGTADDAKSAASDTATSIVGGASESRYERPASMSTHAAHPGA